MKMKIIKKTNEIWIDNFDYFKNFVCIFSFVLILFGEFVCDRQFAFEKFHDFLRTEEIDWCWREESLQRLQSKRKLQWRVNCLGRFQSNGKRRNNEFQSILSIEQLCTWARRRCANFFFALICFLLSLVWFWFSLLLPRFYRKHFQIKHFVKTRHRRNKNNETFSFREKRFVFYRWRWKCVSRKLIDLS